MWQPRGTVARAFVAFLCWAPLLSLAAAQRPSDSFEQTVQEVASRDELFLAISVAKRHIMVTEHLDLSRNFKNEIARLTLLDSDSRTQTLRGNCTGPAPEFAFGIQVEALRPGQCVLTVAHHFLVWDDTGEFQDVWFDNIVVRTAVAVSGSLFQVMPAALDRRLWLTNVTVVSDGRSTGIESEAVALYVQDCLFRGLVGGALETIGESNTNIVNSSFVDNVATHMGSDEPFGTVVVRNTGRARVAGCTFTGTIGDSDDLRPRDQASRIFTDTPASERAVREGSCCGQVLPLADAAASGTFLNSSDERFVALTETVLGARLVEALSSIPAAEPAGRSWYDKHKNTLVIVVGSIAGALALLLVIHCLRRRQQLAPPKRPAGTDDDVALVASIYAHQHGITAVQPPGPRGVSRKSWTKAAEPEERRPSAWHRGRAFAMSSSVARKPSRATRAVLDQPAGGLSAVQEGDEVQVSFLTDDSPAPTAALCSPAPASPVPTALSPSPEKDSPTPTAGTSGPVKASPELVVVAPTTATSGSAPTPASILPTPPGIGRHREARP